MYELIKNICLNNNYVFEYSRNDYSNLFNENEQIGTPHIFLDPIQLQTIFNEFNEEESTIYNGSFMVLVSSDVDDEDYEFKYQNYIKPIITTTMKTIKDAIKCDGEKTIQLWQQIEVVNVFDYNFDGLLVTYSITE
ncbi:MAG: hypothetical protein Q8O62_04415 [Aequorivita sp.]|nr:hypothetical protein [Aequorivita sp.]